MASGLRLWLCLLAATLTDGQQFGRCSQMQQEYTTVEGGQKISICVLHGGSLSDNVTVTARLIQGAEDAVLDSTLAQRTPGSITEYCVTLDTIDDGYIEQNEEVIVEFCAGCGTTIAPENVQCSLIIEDDDAASISCGDGLLIVFEDEGIAQFCGSITRVEEVEFAAVEASIASLNGDVTSVGHVDQEQDNFCVNKSISPDDIAERTERFRTQVILISEGNNGTLRQVDERQCELILVIDDDGPYLECNSVDGLVSGAGIAENIQQFCIVDANAFLFVDMCMDATVGSNDCSHWTLDTYSEFTESSSNQLQILQSYIPFMTHDGCLESVSMILQTLYQSDVMNVGQGSCVVNCVLTIEANACRRAFLLLENISVALLPNSSFITTTIETMCNKVSHARVEVDLDFQCCPPLNCNVSEVTSTPVTTRQPLPPPVTSPPPLSEISRPPPSSSTRAALPQAIIIGAAVGGTVLLVLTSMIILLLIFLCKKHRITAEIVTKPADTPVLENEAILSNTHNTRGDDIAVPPKTNVQVIEGPLDNPAYTHEGVIYTNELVYEEIAADNKRGQKNRFNSVNIDKWREVFTGKILSQVEYQQPIGEGAFGKIFKGRIITSIPGSPSVTYTQVAIKTLKKVSSDQELEDFIAESAIMLGFHHPNILSLVGVIFDTADHLPVIILPFMAHRDLKSYLKSKRTTSSTSARVDIFPNGLNEKILVEMCLDIAKGMQYLSTYKFVHRDLAARNCMVDEALSVKVADFGMSRDVYHSDYYRLTHKARLPVKWMPPESLFNSIFNEKTDVWSFGVTCWEVFSLGRKPFPGIDNVDIPDFISSGHRLKKPSLCSSEMNAIIFRVDVALTQKQWYIAEENVRRRLFNSGYDIMIEMWSDIPEDRPTFEILVTSLASLHQSIGGLDHHYHILNAPTGTVGDTNTISDPHYHVLEGSTANVHFCNTDSEHHYAVLEGPTLNPETSLDTDLAMIDSSSASIPSEYEIPSSLTVIV